MNEISSPSDEKQRKDLNKFIEQKVQGINKLGLHKKGGGSRRPPPPLFVNVAARGRHAYFVYSLDIFFNELIQVLSLLFLFPFAYHLRESLFHL